MVSSRVMMMMDSVDDVEKVRTTTPPISNRIAFGGFVEEVMMCED